MGEQRGPRLAGVAAADAGGVVVRQGDDSFAIELGEFAPAGLRLLQRMDGSATIEQLAAGEEVDVDAVRELVGELERAALLHPVPVAAVRTGVEALLELEDLANELLHETLYRNVYWQAVHASGEPVPDPVLHGTAIENYHFLYRESWFDSPVLSYPYGHRARVLMNEFYVEEIGHDELLLRGISTLGITRDDLADTVPLPETMALCNALAWWARTDPLFFFTTLGVLEGKDLKVDSYLEACVRQGIDPAFVRPIRAHADINLKGEHGSLTRAIFAAVPAVTDAELARMRGLTHVFVELYDAFYRGIWRYYSQPGVPLLRRLPVEGGAAS
jgi:hypothetical protein